VAKTSAEPGRVSFLLMLANCLETRQQITDLFGLIFTILFSCADRKIHCFVNMPHYTNKIPLLASADIFPGGGSRTYFLPKKHTTFLKKVQKILFLAGPGSCLNSILPFNHKRTTSA
jgi:hypothetical protein